ncbi:hypothetical protein QYM36_012703, partial [Artemia franciscana]
MLNAKSPKLTRFVPHVSTDLARHVPETRERKLSYIDKEPHPKKTQNCSPVTMGNSPRSPTVRSSLVFKTLSAKEPIYSKTKKVARSLKFIEERQKEDVGLALVESLNLSRNELKKMEKLNKINIHLQALFAAVENGQVERCRVIAQSSDCDINSPNALGLTLLDVAVLLRNNQMAKMLRNEFGAQEGVKYKNRQDLLDHLGQMELTTNQSLDVLSKSVLIGQNNNQLATGKNNEKEISIWKRRAKMIQLFKEGVEKLRPPPPPDLVDVEVVKSGSVRILFKEIPAIEPSLVSTKLKVQWSTSPGFLNIDGELEIRNPKETQVNIENLDPGQRYFIRACSGNLVGYGDWMTAHPPFVVPSTWRDVDSKKERFEGRSTVFDEIFSEIKSIRSDSELIYDSYDGAAKSKKNTTKSLFQFFAGTPKFQKSLKRGVYLSCILYQDEKVLVTAEDALPVVEVDDGYPASFNTDFHWLMKVGCTWSDVKYLRQAMEKSLSSSTIHFRIKLLQAVAQLQ